MVILLLLKITHFPVETLINCLLTMSQSELFIVIICQHI